MNSLNIGISFDNAVARILEQPSIGRLGWTLLHSLWQFAFLAIVLWLFLKLMSRQSSSSRYVVSCLTLLLMVATTTITFNGIEIDSNRDVAEHTARASSDIHGTLSSDAGEVPSAGPSIALPPQKVAAPEVSSSEAASPPLGFLSVLRTIVEPWLTTIVVLWGVGVVFASTRPLISWYFVRRLRNVGISAVSKETLELLRQTADSLGLTRSVEIVQSKLVEVPAVIGYLRPLILLPLSAVNGLTVQQLEALLAHELAHISRHDYLVNLLQNIVETLLFYHPAVWWVSRKIRYGRENCCDDITVSVSKDRAT
jgi:beta-lactamase regulating signal transducer with metallopeptidase domain